MKRQRVVLVAAVGVALALPARAYAVDHAVLIISPTKLAAHPAWNVHARIVDAAYAGQETFGVSLTRAHFSKAAPKSNTSSPPLPNEPSRSTVRVVSGRPLSVWSAVAAMR
jgi:hypothetical protein